MEELAEATLLKVVLACDNIDLLSGAFVCWVALLSAPSPCDITPAIGLSPFVDTLSVEDDLVEPKPAAAINLDPAVLTLVIALVPAVFATEATLDTAFAVLVLEI